MNIYGLGYGPSAVVYHALRSFLSLRCLPEIWGELVTINMLPISYLFELDIGVDLFYNPPPPPPTKNFPIFIERKLSLNKLSIEQLKLSQKSEHLSVHVQNWINVGGKTVLFDIF